MYTEKLCLYQSQGFNNVNTTAFLTGVRNYHLFVKTAVKMLLKILEAREKKLVNVLSKKKTSVNI